MIEETLDNPVSETVDELKKKFYGVVVGTVLDVLDPMTLGRVKVKLPFIDSTDMSPWARIAVPMSGILAGFYFIPNINDEVLVAFEHGDINAPYVLGSLWNASAPPPLPSPLPQIRMLRTPLGNQIMFTEAPPSIMISTPDKAHQVIIASTGVQVISGTNIINMTPDGITVTGSPNINLVASGALNITASTITITSSAAASLQAGGTCAITAPLVKIN